MLFMCGTRRILGLNYVSIDGPVLDETYAEEICMALGDENTNNCCIYCGPLVQEELHAAMRIANIVINTPTSEGM